MADATRLPALVLNRALLTQAYGRRYLDDYRRLAVAFDHRPETVFASVWQRAAAELGATVTGTWPTLEFRLGNARARVDGWDTHLDPPEAQRRADDKPFVVDRLGEVGLGVPEQHAFSLRSTGAALRHVRGGHGHWVVKPRSSAAGQGVTCGVRTPAELARALVAAGVFGSEFLLERQVEGSGYRFLVLDGELLDVVRRDPSSVEADGALTLRALIRAENVARVEAGGSRGSQLIHLDHDLLLALRSQGLDLETVPPAGTRTRVKQSNADGGRLDTHPVPLASVSAELVDDVKRAVSALGLRLAGVDVLTPDLGRGIAAAGGAILEVNTPAGLHFHSLTAGAPTGGHVATRILQRLLTS